jgi:hypothetical protein
MLAPTVSRSLSLRECVLTTLSIDSYVRCTSTSLVPFGDARDVCDSDYLFLGLYGAKASRDSQCVMTLSDPQPPRTKHDYAAVVRLIHVLAVILQ